MTAVVAAVAVEVGDRGPLVGDRGPLEGDRGPFVVAAKVVPTWGAIVVVFSKGVVVVGKGGSQDNIAAFNLSNPISTPLPPQVFSKINL